MNDLQATAGTLWLANGGAELDHDGAVGRAIQAHWRFRPGDDPYSAFLGAKGSCDSCGETYKHENLSICPNYFATYCYRHHRACACGHVTLG